MTLGLAVRSGCLTGLGLVAGVLALGGCGAKQTLTAPPPMVLSGKVQGGQQPVTDSTIQLYAVGTGGDGSAATPLILTTLTSSDGSGNALDTNANAGNLLNTLPAGAFTITGDYICPSASAEVYLVATGGNPGLSGSVTNANLALMAALGPCGNLSSSTNIFVDEVTTVGSVAALAGYMNSYAAIGSATGDAAALATAFNEVSEYTNTTLGTAPGPTLPASAYGSSWEINTLSDVLSACINSGGVAAGNPNPCASLFAAATPSGGAAPTETIGAALNIIKNPNLNVCPIYGEIPPSPPFEPTLISCPASWALPISTLAVNVTGASSLYVGQTAQYAATVTGATNPSQEQGVTWMVNGIAGGNSSVGTISATGLYTPPATGPGQSVTIGAASVLSSTAVGSTSVTVLPLSVAVTGPASVVFSGTGQYSATVTGTTTQTVTWSVNGVVGGSAAEGTITTGGLYTAPASAPATPVTVSAASTADGTAVGTINVILAAVPVTLATGDSRTVTQPVYPAVCQTVQAQFTTSQRSSPPTTDDTSRLQTALSTCAGTGQSVELQVSGSNNAFYSSELTVNGEGLVIDSGVTLYGNSGYATQSELIKIQGTNASLMGPGTVDGRGDILAVDPQQYTARLVQGSNANNLIIYNVTLQQSIYPNLYVQGGNGFTAWGVTIRTPATRANADGIDIDSLTNATVINSSVEAGDDGIAVKTNASAASNITVANNTFYGTHGISIGSQTFEGVTNVLFTGNTLNGMDLLGNESADPNGVNIKTDPTCGGLVQQVTYLNTCLINVKHLIVLNTEYGTCTGTAGTPQLKDIVVNGVYSTSSPGGTYSQFTGSSATYPIQAFLANISVDKTTESGSNQYAGVALDNSNVIPTGTGVTTSTWSTAGSVPSCTF